MGKIFGAIRRVFRACCYVLSGGMISWAEELESTEGGIRSTYDDVRSDQKKNINSMRTAHSQYTTLKMDLESTLEGLSGDLKKANKHKAGAKALAEKRLQAVGKSNIKGDQEYQKYSRLFSKANGNVKKSQEEYDQKESELQGILDELEVLERDMTEMFGDLQEINKEEAATIADMSYSKSKRQAMEAKAGIATTGVSEARSRMQELRRKNLAMAESASKLAGSAAQDDMRELEEAAIDAAADDELDALLGLSEEVETVAAADSSESINEKLPE